jgi:hypothetical protein
MMLQEMPMPPSPPAPPVPGQVIVTPGGPDPFDALPPPAIAAIFLMALAVVGFVLFPLARAIGRRIERGAATVDPAELDELRQRVAELEERQHRMFELEERLDFAERMLADRTRDVSRLEGGDPRA